MLKTIWFMLSMELILRLRRSQEWLYPLGFFIVVICLFPLAFTPDPAFLQQYIPGCIWIAALLASLLSIDSIFLNDLNEGHLEQIILNPNTSFSYLLAKLSAQWLVTELPLIMLTPILGLLFHLPLSTILALMIGLILGTPILTLIGSLGVALTIGLRQQGVLLSLLILPLVTPVLIFGVNIVQQSQAGLPFAGPLAFLAGLSLFAIILLPWAILSTLAISLDN